MTFLSLECEQLDGLVPAALHQPAFVCNVRFIPLLDSNASKKRTAHQDSAPPAKRHIIGKMPLATGSIIHPDEEGEEEDKSWVDSLPHLDSWSCSEEAFETMSLGSYHAYQQESHLDSTRETNSDSQHNPVLIPNVIQEDAVCHRLDSHLDVVGLPEGLVKRPTPTKGCIPTVVSPVVRYTDSVPKHIQPIGLLRQQQSDSMGLPSDFTIIAKLRNSTEPALLTLTSYPFRVIYANEAFCRLTGRQTSVVGDSVFDLFGVEGRVLRPSLGTFPTLVGKLENAIVQVPCFLDEQQALQYPIRCSFRACPVTKKTDSSTVQYFIIRFVPLQASR